MLLARGLLAVLAGALGGAAVVLPSIAQSETAPTIEAQNSESAYKEQHHYWQPSTAEVRAGGGVIFQNASSSVPHGVVWTSGPEAPSCPGVPINKGETSWKGTCTFTHPGVYAFHCYVHPVEMTGSVTVNANGETTTSTNYTAPTTTGSTTAPASPSSGAQQGALTAPASPLAGSAANAVQLRASQRGRLVRGAVEISQAGAGGRLEVELLAKSASLASAGHPAKVRVGRLVLAHLQAGMVAFSVPLNGRARGAVRRHHRLAITARIQIRPLGGPVLTIARSIVVRP